MGGILEFGRTLGYPISPKSVLETQLVTSLMMLWSLILLMNKKGSGIDLSFSTLSPMMRL
jgi:hypothetical protein